MEQLIFLFRKKKVMAFILRIKEEEKDDADEILRHLLMGDDDHDDNELGNKETQFFLSIKQKEQYL